MKDRGLGGSKEEFELESLPPYTSRSSHETEFLSRISSTIKMDIENRAMIVSMHLFVINCKWKDDDVGLAIFNNCKNSLSVRNVNQSKSIAAFSNSRVLEIGFFWVNQVRLWIFIMFVIININGVRQIIFLLKLTAFNKTLNSHKMYKRKYTQRQKNNNIM